MPLKTGVDCPTVDDYSLSTGADLASEGDSRCVLDLLTDVLSF